MTATRTKKLVRRVGVRLLETGEISQDNFADMLHGVELGATVDSAEVNAITAFVRRNFDHDMLASMYVFMLYTINNRDGAATRKQIKAALQIVAEVRRARGAVE